MLGILLVLLAMSSLSAASYKIGGVMAVQSPTEDTQQQYNISLVVVAIAFMLALCGLLMATSGWNPFSDLSSATMTRSSNGLSLL